MAARGDLDDIAGGSFEHFQSFESFQEILKLKKPLILEPFGKNLPLANSNVNEQGYFVGFENLLARLLAPLLANVSLLLHERPRVNTLNMWYVVAFTADGTPLSLTC